MTQTEILGKGLTYIPSTKLHADAFNNALLHFNRSIRIKHFFRDEPQRDIHPFRQKSTWMPPRGSTELENYIKRIEKETEDMQPKWFHNNLSKDEMHALKTLAADPTLIIKNADKGSGIVVEDRDNYIKDGLEHLSDTSI